MKRLKFSISILLLLSSIQAQDPIKVGFYDNEPVVFMDMDGKANGLFIDILEHIAKDEKWIIEYVHGSWDDCIARLESGEIDLLLGIAFTVERNLKYNYNNIGIIDNWAQVYISEKSNIQSMIDLEWKNIAVQKGDIYFETLEAIGNESGLNFLFTEVSDYIDIIHMISEGKVEAGLVPRSFGQYNEKGHNVKKSFINFKPVELRIAAPLSNNDEILTKIDNHIALWKNNKNSYYYQSINRWIEGVNKLVLPKWLSPYGTLLLVCIIFLSIGILIIILKWQIRIRSKALVKSIISKDIVENDLRQSEENYRSIMEQASDGIFIFNSKWQFLECNITGLKIMGLVNEELPSSQFLDFLILDDDLDQSIFLAKLFDGEITLDTGKIVRNDGSNIPIEISAKMLDDSRIVAIIRDISKRKVSEDKLKVLSLAIDQSPGSILITDNKGTTIYVNQQYYNITGFSQNEIIGKKFSPLKNVKSNEDSIIQFWKTIHAGEIWNGKFTISAKNGIHFMQEVIISPIKNNVGEISHFLIVLKNINAR